MNATSDYYCSYGLRDAQTERDSFVIANWVHTISPNALFSVAPFYHFNQSNYDSLSTDSLPQPPGTSFRTTWAHRPTGTSILGWNSFSGGLYSFYQKENDLFGVQVNDGSGPSQPNTPANANAGLVEFYIGDHLRLGQYVTLLGGERFSDLSRRVWTKQRSIRVSERRCGFRG